MFYSTLSLYRLFIYEIPNRFKKVFWKHFKIITMEHKVISKGIPHHQADITPRKILFVKSSFIYQIFNLGLTERFARIRQCKPLLYNMAVFNQIVFQLLSFYSWITIFK